MFHLTLRYLLQQRRRTLITVVSMILAVSMVTSVGLIVSALQNMLIVDQTGSNGTWHYKLILSDTATESQRQQFYNLAASPEVEAAGKLNEQLYLQMAGGAENYYGLKQLDGSAMELMPYGGRITSGRMPEKEKEILISNGSAAFWNSTDPLGQTAVFTVMKASDMTIVQTVKGENAVITATESYEEEFVIVGTFERFRASNAPNISEAASILPEGSIAEALYLRLSNGGNFSKRITDLVSEAGLDSVVTVEAHNRYLRWILQGEDAIKYAFIIIFTVLTLAVLLVVMIVIKNSYTLSVVKKTDLYGILRCLNASGNQIRQFVIWEGILTWAAAIPFGCIAGGVAMNIIISRAANLGITTLQGLQMKLPLWPFAAALIASFLTMMLSVLSVCKTACAITPVEAFRGNDPFGGSERKEPSAFSQRLGMTLPCSLLLILRDVQKSKGRFFITVFAILVSVAMFTSFAGAAVTVTDFMGSYIDKSGMDFYFASSHHVDKTPESYQALRQDLSQYTAITGMQEVYPIEYLLDVPEDKITPGYDDVWKQFYPVDRPFLNIPAYSSLGDNLKTVEIIPVNEENFRELSFTGSSPSYPELLSSGQVIFCQSEVFRLNGMMQITQFGTFRVGDTVRVAQLVNDEMMPIRELTIGAVLESTPWFAPEKSHGFILVPIETIEDYFEQGTLPTNLYTTGIMSIRVDPEQLPEMQETLYQRSVAAFGALNGFVFNSPYVNNQDVEKQVDLINLCIYGFLILIAVICGLNIFNTVWADVEGKRREIALLRAVGMDTGTLAGYLYGGALMYAVAGMLPGGLMGYLILYAAIEVLKNYLFISLFRPALVLLATFAVTLLLTVIAGSLPIHRVRKSSIVEQLRSIS